MIEVQDYDVANGGPSGATVTVDTTAGNLAIIGVSKYVPGTSLVVSENQGNTVIPLTSRNGSEQGTQLFYCVLNNKNATHEFTVAGSGIYADIGVLIVSGADTSPFDQESGHSAGSAVTIQPGSLTPAVDGSLVVSSYVPYDDTTGVSVDSGMTIFAQATGGSFTLYIAQKVQVTAAAINPQWSAGGEARDSSVAMAIFKPAPPAGSLLYPGMAGGMQQLTGGLRG